MANLYSNENFPIPVVRELRILGHDVVTIQERGRANESTPDPEVLNLATAEGRVVLTLNRKDFYRLHEQTPFIQARFITMILPPANDTRGSGQRLDGLFQGNNSVTAI